MGNLLECLNKLIGIVNDVPDLSKDKNSRKEAELILIGLRKRGIVLRINKNGENAIKINEYEDGGALKTVGMEDLKAISRGHSELDLDIFNYEIIEQNFNFYNSIKWKQDPRAPRGQSAFNNRDSLLKPGNYMEYDVLPITNGTSPSYNSGGRRGKLRFVRNTGNGRVYFTYDHYRCFMLISSQGKDFLK